MPYAIEYDGLGGPEVLEYRAVERAVPGAGQVVVDVRAVGVNPIDGSCAPVRAPRARSPGRVASARMPRG